MVREIEIEKLNAAPYNPRIELEPGMPEWEKLRVSIETFGSVEPIVWNERTGNVVGGHQRLKVIKFLGHKTALCSVVDLSEDDEKILNIALNKIKGKWDYEKLEAVLRDFDYEVATVSGFSADELAILFSDDSDLDDGDYDLDGWEDDAEEQFIGGSYVVTLQFANRELAAEWAKNNGYDDQIREGANTTVIRVEE
jgi:ParB-like chromosome segregation protein Spo0J